MSYCTTFNALVIVVVIYMLTLVWCFDCFLAPAQHWDQGARLACNGLRTERFIISQLRGRRRRRRRTRRRRRMKGKGKFCAFCPIFGQWIFFCLDFTKRTLTSNQCNIKSAQICFTHLGWRHKRFQTGQLLRKSSFHWFYLAGNSRQGGRVLAVGCCLGLVLTTPPTRGGCIFCPKSGLYTLTITGTIGVYFGDITNDRFWNFDNPVVKHFLTTPPTREYFNNVSKQRRL